MKKKLLSALLAALLCIGMTACTRTQPEQTTAAQTEAQPVVTIDEDRQTAPDGTEYVTSLIETVCPDGTRTVEAKDEILYTDGSAYCESQLSTYHADGTKTVVLSATQTDAQGNVTVLEEQILEYDADGQRTNG